MTSFIIEMIERTSLVTKLNTDLANGVMDVCSGATVLVSFTLPPSANNTVANGVLTFGAIANANGVANGVANNAKLYNTAKANLIATADAGMANTTVVLDNSNIAVNQVCSVTSANVTMPAGT